MSASLIVTIIVVVFLLVFIVIGCVKGFLRIALGTCSLILTLIIAGALVTPLSGYIENGTDIGNAMRTRIQDYVSYQLSVLPEAEGAAEDSLVQSLPLPASMKQTLIDNNTVSGYLARGVDSFSEYIAVNLTHLVICILCYVLLFIIIFLIIRLIMRLSKLINHIPVLGGINRLFGGIFGFVEAVLFLWIISMIIMMMSGTEFGITCEKVIDDSVFLKFIYEHNYLMAVVNGIIGLF